MLGRGLPYNCCYHYANRHTHKGTKWEHGPTRYSFIVSSVGAMGLVGNTYRYAEQLLELEARSDCVWDTPVSGFLYGFCIGFSSSQELVSCRSNLPSIRLNQQVVDKYILDEVASGKQQLWSLCIWVEPTTPNWCMLRICCTLKQGGVGCRSFIRREQNGSGSIPARSVLENCLYSLLNHAIATQKRAHVYG